MDTAENPKIVRIERTSTRLGAICVPCLRVEYKTKEGRQVAIRHVSELGEFTTMHAARYAADDVVVLGVSAKGVLEYKVDKPKTGSSPLNPNLD